MTLHEEVALSGQAASGITRVVVTATPEVVEKLFTFIGFSSVPTVPKRLEAVVAADGSWSASLSELPSAGRYQLSVTAYDARGASSMPTESVLVDVQPGLLLGALSFVLSMPVLLLLLLGAVLMAGIHLKKGTGRIHERIDDVEKSLKHSFATMRRNIDKERVLLHRRHDAVSEREEELLEVLEENIETAETRAEEKLAQVERAAEKSKE